MPDFGFLRIAVAQPELRVADCAFNRDQTRALLERAAAESVDLVVFPEMGLTGYTCGDLFHQSALQRAAEEALAALLAAPGFDGLFAVGLPVVVGPQIFNAAAVCRGGTLLGVVPKTYLPNSREYYDSRYFSPARTATTDEITLAGQTVPFGTESLFDAGDFLLGIEICEDLWMPIPPSSRQALAGATVLVNLSASNETVGKPAYRRELIAQQSARCLAAYAYSSCGVGESSTDLVFGGHGLIAENGTILAESDRFARQSFTMADIDLGRLRHERVQSMSFHQELAPERLEPFVTVPARIERTDKADLRRHVDAHPFVPAESATRDDRCREIFAIQVAGLAKRLEHVGVVRPTIGISGGLDSTLALLVLVKAADRIGLPRSAIHGLTMPGFGTTPTTRTNSLRLMAAFGLTAREIDIRELCLDQWKTLGHAPFGIPLDGETVDSLTAKVRSLPADRRHDLTFENVQARQRTSLLMNTGFVIGTGDLSELALGWCTYNADHMSMYNPNVSVPKTLVRFLVRWAADHEFDGEVRTLLHAIADGMITPELLPTGPRGEIVQDTEAAVGPYELVDFFLYHFLRFGTPPEKILYLAGHAKFDREYSPAERRQWLTVFLKRFFANQFKRSCLPDGPKVGSVSLSPRGDWRMPSDAVAKAWLDRLS